MKKFMAVAICAVVAVLAGLFSNHIVASYTAQLDDQQGTISFLSNKVDVLEAANNAGDVSAKASSAGIDTDRVDQDKTALVTWLNTTLGQSSASAYLDKRTEVAKKYKLSDTNAFLSDVMPSSAWPCGVAFFELDSGVSVSFEPTWWRVSGIAGEKYSYMVSGTLHVGSATQQVLLQATLNGKQEVVDISAVEL